MPDSAVKWKTLESTGLGRLAAMFSSRAFMKQ